MVGPPGLEWNLAIMSAPGREKTFTIIAALQARIITRYENSYQCDKALLVARVLKNLS